MKTPERLVPGRLVVSGETAALVIPAAVRNHGRYSKLQRFMLAHDRTTIAVEVPIWLDERDIAALEAEHGTTFCR